MATKRGKRATKKVKSLKAKSLSSGKAKRVRGGASDMFVKLGSGPVYLQNKKSFTGN